MLLLKLGRGIVFIDKLLRDKDTAVDYVRMHPYSKLLSFAESEL